MSFIETVEHARGLLERNGHLSLRALRRHFDLDEESLADLVAELVDVQNVAAREGEVLSWIGVDGRKGPARGSGTQGTEQRARGPGVLATRAPEAERRQLTVLFCDLVNSTSLAASLDAEEWRELVRSYQQAASDVVERYDGHVAQYLGDGLLIYFGWPTAHEDDPERAVRAGLEIVEAVAGADVRLAARIGIHTGHVVVGEIGGGAHRETLAMGKTTHVAARIEAKAEPGGVLMSSVTIRLVAGIFVTEDLGKHALKGVGEIHLHRAIRPRGMRSRLDVASAKGLTPLVARHHELALLEERFSQVSHGYGQAVLISGEPGVGKSRLVHAFRQRVAKHTHIWLECRCSPYAQDSPLHPLIALTQQEFAFRLDDPPGEKLNLIEKSLTAAGFDLDLTMPLLAEFHSLRPPDRFPGSALSAVARRKKTLEFLTEWLFRIGQRHPLVLLFEDLHWVDPSTRELIGEIVDRLPREQVQLLVTHRPDFEVPWGSRSHVTPILLAPLTRAQVGDLVRKASGAYALPAPWVNEIVRRSDGVPLFAEELTKAVVDAHPEPPAPGMPVPMLDIPDTLHDLLTARLDALGSVKELAQVASVLGRDFSYDLLRRVASIDDAKLRLTLRTAVGRELLYQRGSPPNATYLFKHSLIHEAAYATLLRSRRAELHATVAAVLESNFPEIAASSPELLAHHHAAAGQVRRAIDRWHEAGRLALRRSASREAAAHLKRALDLATAERPSSEHDREELDLHIELGAATMMSHGWGSPESELWYARARDLCAAVGDENELFPIVWGFWIIHMARADVAEWRKAAAELLDIAERTDDPMMLVQAHHASWGNPFLGDFVVQLEHVERGLSGYDRAKHSKFAPQYGGHDAGVCGHGHRGVALWATGYPERSGASFAAAVALADEIGHAPSKAHSLLMGAWQPIFGSDWAEVLRVTDAAMAISNEVGLATWTDILAVLRGWAVVSLGESDDGLEEMRRGLEGATLSSSVGSATCHALYAEALCLTGATEEALAQLHTALPLMEERGEGLWKANAMALAGDLLVARGLPADAEASYRSGIDVARAQSAKMWELRVATRLARLLKQQGNSIAARELLTPIYDWFTEGFETKDLRDAKGFLEDTA